MMAKKEHMTSTLLARERLSRRTSSGKILYFVGLNSALCADIKNNNK